MSSCLLKQANQTALLSWAWSQTLSPDWWKKIQQPLVSYFNNSQNLRISCYEPGTVLKHCIHITSFNFTKLFTLKTRISSPTVSGELTSSWSHVRNIVLLHQESSIGPWTNCLFHKWAVSARMKEKKTFVYSHIVEISLGRDTYKPSIPLKGTKIVSSHGNKYLSKV
jgi:hypothetical protein